ncbi:ER membrane protein complex subunit 3 [Sarotherodon galilaeus]
MATTVGSVAPFDSELQSWEEYCEILDYFFVANDIKEEEKKRAVLLSCVGTQTYALIRNLLSPVKPGDRSYAELVGLLDNHFHPKPSEIVQRWKFNTWNRRPEESVGDYVAELRKLAQDCNFGDSLTVMLRDRLVCGISDDRIQRRLLAEDSLTFEKALKFAQAMEAANRDIMEDGGSMSQQIVRKCYRCGGLNHVAKDCRFVSEKCHNCGKVGHIKRVCRMKMEQKGGRGRQGKQAHFLEEENVESEEEGAEMHHIKASSVTMYNVHEEISIPREEPIRQKLKVNGQNVTFEVDTGCGYTIMSKESFKKLFEGSNAPKVSKCGIKLRTYGGHKVPVWGAARIQVEFRDGKKKLDVVVVEGAGTSDYKQSKKIKNE